MNTDKAKPDYEIAREQFEAIVKRLGLTCVYEFVPFSQSRSKAEKSPSLNYRVTVQRVHTGKLASKAVDVLTCDYGMGCAHAPSYKSVKGEGSICREKRIAAECETGFPQRWIDNAGGGSQTTRVGNSKPIRPRDSDVLSSLCMDADVLNSSSFEDWASEYGYDTDSRKAEAIYRQCLELALALKNAIGSAELEALQELAHQL